jgi:polyphenol oxidase
VKFKVFQNFPELTYGLSEKRHGFMDTKPMETKALDKQAVNNRAVFFKLQKFSQKVVAPMMTHSAKVVTITGNNWHKLFNADGFITGEPDIYLTITVADCFPVYLYDKKQGVVGLVHCGWRGIAKNILPTTINKFQQIFKSDPKNIIMAVGPGIQQCHFSFKDKPEKYFKDFPHHLSRKKDHTYINLPGILKDQAKEAGLKTVELSMVCTYDKKDKYFSHRRDQFPVPRVMVAYIAKKGNS